jgi:hypothetical protein
MKMMRDAFGKADKKPSPYPIQDPIRTDLEHETKSTATSKQVKCLFSMN